MVLSSNALLLETVPNPFHVVPSVEYCQVPLPTLLVIAIPFDGLVSTSAHVELVRIEVTVVPEDVVFSSVPVKVTEEALVIVGASLTEVTVIEAVAALVE